jgi:hypothetical protein
MGSSTHSAIARRPSAEALGRLAAEHVSEDRHFLELREELG